MGRKYRIVPLIIAAFLCLNPSLIDAQSQDIVIGSTDSVYSSILHENRLIWVYTPRSEGVFPVVYLLDGSAHFRSVAGMIRQLSRSNGNTVCPEMIVVAILNTDRDRDLTPTKGDTAHPYVDTALAERSGGGEKFIRFLEKELIPYVNSKYPASPYRMLIGHSYGGLTVLHTLLHHTELFKAYVAIEPSLWWSNQQLLKEYKSISPDKKFDGRALYLAIANTMPEGMDTSRVSSDTHYSTMPMRSLLDFKKLLEKDFQERLRLRAQYYPEDDHISVPLIAEYDAIRFIFNDYKFIFDPTDRDNPKVDLYKKIIAHYRDISKNLGYRQKPGEQFINNLAYHYLFKKNFQKAALFFQLNVANYPQSDNAYDACGDYFRAVGEPDKALEYYRKSVSLNKDSRSKQKIEQLQSEVR